MTRIAGYEIPRDMGELSHTLDLMKSSFNNEIRYASVTTNSKALKAECSWDDSKNVTLRFTGVAVKGDLVGVNVRPWEKKKVVMHVQGPASDVARAVAAELKKVGIHAIASNSKGAEGTVIFRYED